jgi:hypothetical protein
MTLEILEFSPVDLIMNFSGMITGSMQGKLQLSKQIYQSATTFNTGTHWTELLSDALLSSFPASTNIRVLFGKGIPL